MSCPVCGNDAFELDREVSSMMSDIPEGLDRGPFVQVRIERCLGCGLYRTVHISDERTAHELYEKDSLSHEASAAKVREAGTRSTSSTDELSLLSVRPPASVLDVGCGAGQFLLRAAWAGYDVQGIDPDPRSVAFVNDELGIKARSGSFEVLDSDERFDVIVMMGVLEHIDVPAKFLRSATEHLSERGELLVGVPNVESLSRRVSRLSEHDWDMFLEPGHHYHYGPETLRRLATIAGFEVQKWATATITIRGKVPPLPVRFPGIERVVRGVVSRNALAQRAYVSSLRLLDRFNAGDMLFSVLRPGG